MIYFESIALGLFSFIFCKLGMRIWSYFDKNVEVDYPIFVTACGTLVALFGVALKLGFQALSRANGIELEYL